MNIEEKYINCNHIWINDKCIKCELDRKMYEYGSKYGEDLLFQNESIMYNTIKNNVNIMKKGINIIVKKEDEEIIKTIYLSIISKNPYISDVMLLKNINYLYNKLNSKNTKKLTLS